METQLLITEELGFTSKEEVEDLLIKLNKIQKMLVNFQKHLNNT
ncbi:four helix bundle protein [Candidatus Marifrigoribacter sp. Uisw_064]